MTVDDLRSTLQIIDATSVPILRRTPRTVALPVRGHHLARKRPEMPAPEASEHSLLRRCHLGDQDAATQLATLIAPSVDRRLWIASI
jgi:hypothetical protein